ncbi:hypothetical protein BGW42_003912 [Actinomortierella wolfii]|nr:hypothetical protein BGW42_003912 [Actinomortierella wolfii]
MDYTTLSRLKLQSLCVKYGLDASGKNDELIFRLQVHAGQISKDSAPTPEAATTNAVSARNTSSTEPHTDATAEAVSQLHVSIKQEEQEEHNVLHGDAPQSPKVTTPIKQEEQPLVAMSMDSISSPEVKQEADHSNKMENPFLVKTEEEAPSIKNEPVSPEIKTEVDMHETAMSRRELQAFWETRSKSSQMTASYAAKDTKSPHPSKITGKRPRSSTLDNSGGEDDKGTSSDLGHTDTTFRSQSPSDSMPPVGTVRKLVGRFASGSSIAPEPVGSPSAIKRQRIDHNGVPPTSPSVVRVVRHGSATSTASSTSTTHTSTTPGTGSAIANSKPKISRRAAAAEAARRVIKIPTVKKENAAEASASPPTTTPPPPTTPRKGVTTPKRRASSAEDYPGAEIPTKRTYRGTGRAPSAETINRLATPKNKLVVAKKTASSSSVSASTNTHAPPTPTRPRAPVLSTASRAAQRAKRNNH